MSKEIFGAAACIKKDDSLLLVQQPPVGDHANLWGPPGGHTLGNETPMETAIREVREETGLDIKLTGIVGVGPYEGAIVVIFSAVPVSKNPRVDIQQEEVQSFAWVTLGELTANKYDLRIKLLRDALINSLTKDPFPLEKLQELISQSY